MQQFFNLKQKNHGFTLIELVIVIVIIGILAAVALPKFANLTAQARNASNKGIAGGFTSAVGIAHAAWYAAGSSAVVGGSNITMEGTSVHVNTLGWPDGSGNVTPTPAQCAVLWGAILTNPPIAGCPTCVSPCTTSSTNNCYVVTSATSVCTYTLSSNAANTITFDTSNGTVTSAP